MLYDTEWAQLPSIDQAALIINSLLYLLSSGWAAGHALLYKRDSRSGLCWCFLAFMLPFLGPLAYALLGINRIKTRTQKLGSGSFPEIKNHTNSTQELLAKVLTPDQQSFSRAGETLTGRPLTYSWQITPYFSGQTCYDAMLERIRGAKHTICLSSFIFAADKIGKTFITSLIDAHQRGVSVQVLIDGVGALYSFSQAKWRLKRAGVPCAHFIPARLWPPSFHLNLRNHRKLLIIDEQYSFVGGINIQDRHLPRAGYEEHGKIQHQAIQDIHFQFCGPITHQLQQVFDEDWYFATGQDPHRAQFKNLCEARALEKHICRVITDGPNEDLDKLTTILSSVIALAKRRIAIITPYFLPPSILVGALRAAALRKVDVIIILPEKSNLPPVQWATQHMLWQLLKYGVRILYQPEPFSHSKLILIDEHYAQVGSANLDERSLRLNFEIMIEVYDSPVLLALSAHFNELLNKSRAETLAAVDARPIHIRLRDAIARLFSPYL